MSTTTDSVREKALSEYRKKLLEHKELEARLKESMYCILLLTCIYFGHLFHNIG